MKYVLEPMLFAFDQDLSKEALTDYLEELQTLDEWWNCHREDMYVQQTAEEVLWNNSYYPMAETLKPLMEKHGINFMQYNDVNKIIVKMLGKSKIIDNFGDVLCGMKSQKLTQPMKVDENVKRTQELDDELMSLLWHIFMAHEMGGKEEKSFVVITKGISDIVSVKYEYEVIEGDQLVEKSKISNVNCKRSLADFLSDQTTPFLLWKTAERKDDLDLGVRVSIMQWKGESDISSIYDGYNFKIQDSFYEDYCNGHYQSKDQDIRSTIQTVTEAVTDQKLRQMHAIRTGQKGSNPPLIVQNYDAQRREITTSIKLAYWKKGREYKIANMREHDFFEPTWEQ